LLPMEAIRRFKPFILPVCMLVISLMVYLLAIYVPVFTTAFYARAFYKWCSQFVSRIVSLLPFSLAELIIVLFPLLLCFLLIKGIWLVVCTRTKAFIFWKRLGIVTLKCFCYVLSAFILFAGVNYWRVPLADRLGLEVAPASQHDLMQLCIHLRDAANESAKLTARTQEGKYMPAHSFSETKKMIALAYDSLSVRYDDFKGTYPSSKPLLFSRCASYAYIMGFFFPFTFESNINKDIPEFMIPAVVAHEQAHIRGFMREEEAEFSVFLLTRYTDDIDLKYSFNLSVFMRSISVLYKVDSEMYALLLEELSEPLFRDLCDYSDYWRAFRSPVGKVSKAINDIYLKANSQIEGVQSYGKVVDLLIAEYKHIQIL